MRSHTHEHLFWCIADRGNFESLRQWKKRGFWHFLPPLIIFFEESVADFSEITSESPKSGKSQLYVGVHSMLGNSGHRQLGGQKKQPANDFLKSGMQFPFSAVGRMRNTREHAECASPQHQA